MKPITELVIMQNKDIYTTSLIMSENLNIKHKNVLELLKDYSHIQELQRFETAEVKTKGRPIKIALLTEIQALLLVSLMKNSAEVIDFKVKLVKAFVKYRKIVQQLITQKQNEEWLLNRGESKEIRKECTDTIKDFIEYAIKQGSKSAALYYVNLSKMELKGLFLLEQRYPNAREVMNMKQLTLIKMADEAVRITLEEEMKKDTHYKEIYKLAKAKIDALASIFPKSPLPALLTKD